MTEQKEITELTQYLPSLKLIKDRDVATKIARVWYKALEMSPWETVGQVRFKEGMDNVSLISHVNSTVECALAVSRIIRKFHGVDFNEQLIITLGLLHDVDKIVEYIYNENGELVVSDIGRKIQHGVLTAMLAREVGFDVDMQHMIITHTPNQNMKPLFKEAILFGYVDLCDWEITYRFSNR